MARASDELLSRLHAMVGEEIQAMLESDDLKTRIVGIDKAIRFLKDNNITATIETSPNLGKITENLPTADELERLMHLKVQ